MKTNFEGILTVVGLVTLAVMLLGYPVMWLWNWLMPVIFGLPYITFYQAVGLNLMSTILFKSSVTVKKN
jgi:hypothetical protein